MVRVDASKQPFRVNVGALLIVHDKKRGSGGKYRPSLPFFKDTEK